jgi:hypothetical protein
MEIIRVSMTTLILLLFTAYKNFNLTFLFTYIYNIYGLIDFKLIIIIIIIIIIINITERNRKNKIY